MKFKATTSELKKALQKLGNAVNTKSVIPATSHIRADVINNAVILSTTDLQTSITYVLETSENIEGIFLIPFQVLKNIIDVEDNGITDTCEIEVIEEVVNVKFNNGDYFNLGKTISEKEFPKLPKYGKNNLINIGIDFLNAFKMASSSVLKTNDGSILSNIFLDFTQNEFVKVVSTDKFSVYTYDVAFEGTLEEPAQLLLLPTAAKVFDELDERLQISFNKKHVFFQYKNIVVSSRLCEGKYVDYKSVMPSKNANLSIDINTIKVGVAKAMVMTNEELTGVDFTISENNALQLKTEADNCNILLPCECEKLETSIRVSGKLLKRTLAQMNEDTGDVLFTITNANKKIGIEHSNNKNIHLLIMPIFSNK